MAEEGLTKTDNDLIHIGKPIPFDTDEFLHQLEKLAVVAYGNDPDIRNYVEEIVPTYHAAKDDLKLHGDTYVVFHPDHDVDPLVTLGFRCSIAIPVILLSTLSLQRYRDRLKTRFKCCG